MKVLYIVSAYPRWPGDVITPWLVETIRRLRGRGVEVEVLAPAYRGQADQTIDGVRVHRFRYGPAAWETLTHDQTAPDRVRERPYFLALVPPYVLAGSLAAARLARRGGFDMVHDFWPVPHGILGAAAKYAAGIPLVSTFFGVELTWVRSQLSVLRPVVRGIIRASDAVTVISLHTAREVRALAGDVSLHRIPFGAAVGGTWGRPAARATRPPGGPLRLLFVGRLVERKGVQVLLDAVAGLPPEAARLTVVGDGPMRPALEARSERLGLGGRVEFTGAVPRDELERRFREADALVLPAVRDAKGDTEGLGVVLIEALGYGVPVIASESGGIVDIVRHEETGLLVPPGDPEALRAAIERYRRDPEEAARLAARGRDFVAQEFSWDAITARLVALYEQVRNSHGQRS